MYIKKINFLSYKKAMEANSEIFASAVKRNEN